MAPVPVIPQIILRPSQDREHSDYGWLKTFHTFSPNPRAKHVQWGSLRIINEDRVDPSGGFGAHSHREMNIFSYVVSGTLRHGDSMGNVEFLKRGGVQLTCAGTGITHSEEPHGEEVHFLQIWAFSHTSNLKPKYFTRNFEESEKEDKWAVFIAPVGTPDAKPEREATGPAPIHSNLYASATLLSTSKSLVHTQRSPKAYVHVPQISGYNPKVASGAAIRITSADGITAELHEGDGAYIVGERGAELTFSNIGDRRAEIVVLDVDAEQ